MCASKESLHTRCDFENEVVLSLLHDARIQKYPEILVTLNQRNTGGGICTMGGLSVC